jgi:hypothetical protein
VNLNQLIARLKPSSKEIEELMLRETDPALAPSFEPLTPGPAAAAMLLALIAVAGVLLAPLRIITRGR